MKILHVTNRLSEGGVETFLYNLLPSLKEKGHEVSLLVLDKSEIKMKGLFEAAGICVIVAPFSSIYDARNIRYLYTQFKQYDLIHSHLFPSQYFTAISAFLAGKKTITTEHCTENKRRKLFFWPLEFMIYLSYDSIIGVSNAAVSNLSRWMPMLGKKIKPILNGIKLDQFSHVNSIDRKLFGINADDFLIVMTARFFEQKDHDTLIRALTYLPSSVKTIFIGSGERLEICVNFAKKLNVTDRCIFLGRRDDVASIVNIADICVLSTNYEGLPVSIIEYMACGKPVIATNVDGVDEMIDHHFLFDKGDAENLAEKINLLRNDEKLLALQSYENKRKSTEYELDKMVCKYIEEYNKLS